LNSARDIAENSGWRSIQREALNLAYADEQERRLAESLNQRNEQEEAALAEVQAAHEANAAQQLAESQFRAKEAKMADQFAREFTEEEVVRLRLCDGSR
jgi:hypothetical protein